MLLKNEGAAYGTTVTSDGNQSLAPAQNGLQISPAAAKPTICNHRQNRANFEQSMSWS